MPLFWAALASLIVVYIFIVEIAVLAFLIVCALPLLIAVMRALGLTHRLPHRELHPETGKIGQDEVDKRVKLVYYTPAEEEDDEAQKQGEQQEDGEVAAIGTVAHQGDTDGAAEMTSTTSNSRPSMGSRRDTQDSIQSATSHPALGRFSRLTRILYARQRSTASTARGDDGKDSSSPKSPTRPPLALPKQNPTQHQHQNPTSQRSPNTASSNTHSTHYQHIEQPAPSAYATLKNPNRTKSRNRNHCDCWNADM